MKGFLWRFRATQPVAPFGRSGMGHPVEFLLQAA